MQEERRRQHILSDCDEFDMILRAKGYLTLEGRGRDHLQGNTVLNGEDEECPGTDGSGHSRKDLDDQEIEQPVAHGTDGVSLSTDRLGVELGGVQPRELLSSNVSVMCDVEDVRLLTGSQVAPKKAMKKYRPKAAPFDALAVFGNRHAQVMNLC